MSERFSRVPLSLWEAHVAKWKTCTNCDLALTRKNVVLARGSLPCDLLFVGEGPGRSEDVLGIPFVGPAGQLLDLIICQGLPSWVKYCLSNLICCIPIDPSSQEKVESPPDYAVEACSNRLVELVNIAQPKVIICVGNDAKDWLDLGFKHSIPVPREIPRVHIAHPAWILRVQTARRGLEIQRAVVTLSNTVEEFLKPPERSLDNG